MMKTVDWQVLKQRLAAASAQLETSFSHDSETSQKILSQRALQLAAHDVETARLLSVDHIVFRLGRETYAIETALVVGVFRLTGLARLPGSREPLYGVTLWRGEILTVFDLRAMLGVSTSTLNDLGRVIVIGGERVCFGFLADSVTGEVPVIPSYVHPLPGSENLLVRGITPEAVIVLNPEQLLLLPEHRSSQ
jgi:purine-binding chemotaxis protein CheW